MVIFFTFLKRYRLVESRRKVDKPNELMPHSLQENEKITIRDNIIEAVIHSPDPIRFF